MDQFETYAVVCRDGVDQIKLPDGTWTCYNTVGVEACVEGGMKVVRRGRGRPRKKNYRQNVNE